MRSRAAFVAFLLIAAPAVADDSEPFGVWSGTYTCAQGLTGFQLTIDSAGGDRLDATYFFYPVIDNPQVPDGCYKMTGRWDPATGRIDLSGSDWMLRPRFYEMVDLLGEIGKTGETFDGDVAGPGCTTFELRRGQGPRELPAACLDDKPLARR